MLLHRLCGVEHTPASLGSSSTPLVGRQSTASRHWRKHWPATLSAAMFHLHLLQGNEGIPAWDERLEKLQHDFSAAYKRASPDFQVVVTSLQIQSCAQCLCSVQEALQYRTWQRACLHFQCCLPAEWQGLRHR
jgi:hypothetical protein